MDAIQTLVELSRRIVVIEQRGGKLRFAPQSRVDPMLKAAIRNHKTELQDRLSNDPVDQEMRCQQYGALIERVNARFTGGPINLERLLRIVEPKIWNAETIADLTLAIAEFEAVAIPTSRIGASVQII